MNQLIDDIATATSVYGLMQLANWLPADRHGELKELLHDLTVGALHAYADAGVWRVPEPSSN